MTISLGKGIELRAARQITAVATVNASVMRLTAGGSGQTVTHNDPTYLNANGAFTWVSANPLGQGDDGGTFISAAGAQAGLWSRDARPTTDLSANARLNLDWWEMEDGKDVTSIFKAIVTGYAPRVHMNYPRDSTEIVMDDVSAEHVAVTALHLYEPIQNIEVRPADWNLTEVSGTLTETTAGSNTWEASCPSKAALIWITHDSYKNMAGDGTNANELPTASAVPYEVSYGASSNVAFSAMTERGRWRFDDPILTVWASSVNDLARIRYSDTVHVDKLWTFGAVNDFMAGGNNLKVTYRGKAPVRAMAHNQTSLVPASGRRKFAMHFKGSAGVAGGTHDFFCNTYDFFQGSYNPFYDGNKSGGLNTINFKGTHIDSHMQPRGVKRVVSDNVEFGDRFKSYTGQISRSGASASNFNQTNRGFYSSTLVGGMNLVAVSAAKGTGINVPFPFANTNQVGSAASPIKTDLYSIDFVSTVRSVNGNRTFYDDENSATFSIGKVDGLGDIDFHIKFSDHGVTDRTTGEFELADFVDAGFGAEASAIGVTADPNVRKLSDNSYFAIESTGELPSSTFFNQGMTFQVSGIGVGDISLGTTEERHPGDFGGFHKVFGSGKTETFHGISFMWDNNEINNLKFKKEDRIAQKTAIEIKGRQRSAARRNTIASAEVIGCDIDIEGPAFETSIRSLTVSGDSRKFIRITTDTDPTEFVSGVHLDISISGLTAPVSSTIDVEDPTFMNRSNVILRVDGGNYELPYTVGATNVSAATTAIRTPRVYGHTFFPIGWQSDGVDNPSNQDDLHIPARTSASDLLLGMLAFDRNPGAINGLDGWTELTAANNGSDLYTKFYKKVSDGTEWDVTTPTSALSFKVSAGWATSALGMWYAADIKGVNASSTGGADTVVNASGTSVSAQSYIPTRTDSMIFAMAATPRDSHASAFVGDGWIRAITRQSAKAFGISLQASIGQSPNNGREYGLDTGPSIFACYKYADASGVAVSGVTLPLETRGGGDQQSITAIVEVLQ